MTSRDRKTLNLKRRVKCEATKFSRLTELILTTILIKRKHKMFVVRKTSYSTPRQDDGTFEDLSLDKFLSA